MLMESREMLYFVCFGTKSMWKLKGEKLRIHESTSTLNLSLSLLWLFLLCLDFIRFVLRCEGFSSELEQSRSDGLMVEKSERKKSLSFSNCCWNYEFALCSIMQSQYQNPTILREKLKRRFSNHKRKSSKEGFISGFGLRSDHLSIFFVWIFAKLHRKPPNFIGMFSCR